MEPSRHRHILLSVLAGVGVGVAIAACGSSSDKPSASSGPYGPANSPAAASRCMRANGVSNFPDPSAGPTGSVGFNGLFMSSTGALTVDGINFSGPALKSAEKACRAYLPGGGGPPPAIPAARRLAMLANADCMRKHDVPNFPDPTFPAGGGIRIGIGSGINPQSPAFQNAAKLCGGLTGRVGGRIAVGPG